MIRKILILSFLVISILSSAGYYFISHRQIAFPNASVDIPTFDFENLSFNQKITLPSFDELNISIPGFDIPGSQFKIVLKREMRLSTFEDVYYFDKGQNSVLTNHLKSHPEIKFDGEKVTLSNIDFYNHQTKEKLLVEGITFRLKDPSSLTIKNLDFSNCLIGFKGNSIDGEFGPGKMKLVSGKLKFNGYELNKFVAEISGNKANIDFVTNGKAQKIVLELNDKSVKSSKGKVLGKIKDLVGEFKVDPQVVRAFLDYQEQISDKLQIENLIDKSYVDTEKKLREYTLNHRVDLQLKSIKDNNTLEAGLIRVKFNPVSEDSLTIKESKKSQDEDALYTRLMSLPKEEVYDEMAKAYFVADDLDGTFKSIFRVAGKLLDKYPWDGKALAFLGVTTPYQYYSHHDGNGRPVYTKEGVVENMENSLLQAEKHAPGYFMNTNLAIKILEIKGKFKGNEELFVKFYENSTLEEVKSKFLFSYTLIKKDAFAAKMAVEEKLKYLQALEDSFIMH